MMQLLPFPPQEASKQLIRELPTKRMQSVLEKRFGLGGKPAATLEAIGKEYKITRERVRQIERDALVHIKKADPVQKMDALHQALEDHLKFHGGVMEEGHLFTTLVDERHRPHLDFLLQAKSAFARMPEDGRSWTRWAINRHIAGEVEKILQGIVERLEERKTPLAKEELVALLRGSIKGAMAIEAGDHVIESYLHTSKLIRKNPYGEYGVVSWASVSPSGVKDKAHMALLKAGQPLHFREVATAIDRAGWSKKKAHPQTVHNELIKDNRFILVGRGLYALREWGYESGSVREVLISLLGRAKKPMSSEEMVKLVMEKRMVKPQTVLLNLQNKNLFRRTGEGYTLA